MSGLSRLLKLARRLGTGRLERCRTPNRKPALDVEQLEGRIVPTLMGQQLFPTDNPWNQNISNAPLAANSAAIIAHIGSGISIHPDWGADSASNGSSPLYGIPFNVVHGNSTAKVNVIINNYPDESDIVPVPIPAGAVIEGDFQNGPNPSGGGYNSGQRGDSHLIIWDEDTDTAYELFGVTRPSDPKLFPNTSGVELAHTDGQWHAAQETVWNMSTNTFRTIGETSADAAGLSILAGLVRPDEGLPVSAGGQGAIDHALRVTLPGGDVNPQYIYPASHVVNESQGANNLPFGGRLRLANTPAIDTLISNMPPESQIIAIAMQQYGLIVADIGSAMYVTGASATVDNVDSPSTDLVWNQNDIFASNGLRVLTAGDFQVVNLTPVVTGLSATTGASGSTVTITGQNFSGAAGNLSVLFGSTPSPSVTYVSDTQITAVVPSGSGTVNVLVQSGKDETDDISDNPNANSTAPIFGYGTSAPTAADLFTLSSQPVSGTNSTASFGSPSVSSGHTDTLTIVVQDTTGNAVSGLSSSTFAFSLAGGTSAGTFGAVTETATQGTYTTTFTGTTAGTASTLTVTVNGVTFSTTPGITVSVGSVSAANSTVSFASPTVTLGGLDTVTIVVADGARNPITGLASGAFGFALSGGTSAGTFGTVTETATKGTYTAAFTATAGGTASTLTATVNGVILNTRPTIKVAFGISGTNSTISLAMATVAAGGTDLATIVVKDTNGSAVTGLASSAFVFSLAGVSAGTFSPVTETATKGTYTATFTGTTAGTPSTLTAIVSGVALATTPTIQVNAGGPSGTNSAVSFAAPTVASGSTDTLTIVVKDAAGNAVTGLASSSFVFSFAGVSTGTLSAVIESATKGTYTSTFLANKAGTASTLTTTVKSVKLTAKPTVQVTPGAVSAAKSTVKFATPTLPGGLTDTVTILVKDAAGNVISGLSSGAFSFSLSGGGSAGTFSGVTETATKGTYTAIFTAVTVGTPSTLLATVNSVALTTRPTVQVLARQVSGSLSTASFASSTVASGSTDTLTIVVKNSTGIPVSGLTEAYFVFSLKNGTSVGAFGSVTETATKGTYTVTFTGTTAGTADALTIIVNGVTLTVRPTVTVTA